MATLLSAWSWVSSRVNLSIVIDTNRWSTLTSVVSAAPMTGVSVVAGAGRRSVVEGEAPVTETLNNCSPALSRYTRCRPVSTILQQVKNAIIPIHQHPYRSFKDCYIKLIIIHRIRYGGSCGWYLVTETENNMQNGLKQRPNTSFCTMTPCLSPWTILWSSLSSLIYI